MSNMASSGTSAWIPGAPYCNATAIHDECVNSPDPRGAAPGPLQASACTAGGRPQRSLATSFIMTELEGRRVAASLRRGAGALGAAAPLAPRADVELGAAHAGALHREQGVAGGDPRAAVHDGALRRDAVEGSGEQRA